MNLSRVLLLFVTCWPLTAFALQEYTVQVLERKPQSRQNFVQGLEIKGEFLYVSSGNYGESRLLRYRFSDGKLDQARPLDARIFAEGLTVLDNHIYQLTWQNRMLMVYNESDLQLQRWLPLHGEGWGITNNGQALVYSDGSAQLYFLAADTGKIQRTITVTEAGKPVQHLNELEWIDGKVWANVWLTDRIVIIDPDSGAVSASIDLTHLLPAEERRADTDVLNGIALNPTDNGVWVTGKRWPWLYRIKLVPVPKKAPAPHTP